MRHNVDDHIIFNILSDWYNNSSRFELNELMSLTFRVNFEHHFIAFLSFAFRRNQARFVSKARTAQL